MKTGVTQTVKVNINTFELDEKYYSFNYEIFIDDIKYDEGVVDGDHDWENLEDFRDMMLDNNGALELALENL